MASAPELPSAISSSNSQYEALVSALNKCSSNSMSFAFKFSTKSPSKARLRDWQRTTTKLKRNNCNHRDSMGLETPRVDSPS